MTFYEIIKNEVFHETPGIYQPAQLSAGWSPGTCTKEVYGKLAAEDSGMDEIILDQNINHQCERSGCCRRAFEKMGSFNQPGAQSRRKCFEASIEAMLDGELFPEN